MNTTEAANVDVRSQLDTALVNVMQGVYRPHFFAKLAAAGIQPENEVEAEALVNLGFKLAELNAPVPQEPPAAGQATTGQNKFAEAILKLDRLVLGSAELATQRRKSAAIQLAQHPAIYQAALIIDACEKEAAQSPAAAQ